MFLSPRLIELHASTSTSADTSTRWSVTARLVRDLSSTSCSHSRPLGASNSSSNPGPSGADASSGPAPA